MNKVLGGRLLRQTKLQLEDVYIERDIENAQNELEALEAEKLAAIKAAQTEKAGRRAILFTCAGHLLRHVPGALPGFTRARAERTSEGSATIWKRQRQHQQHAHRANHETGQHAEGPAAHDGRNRASEVHQTTPEVVVSRGTSAASGGKSTAARSGSRGRSRDPHSTGASRRPSSTRHAWCGHH